MSLSDDKKNIFTTIGAYTSLKEERNLPDTTNLFSSINNKKDVVPFLLDIIKTVVGTDALKQLTGQLFTDFIDNVEPKIKAALSKQMIQYNAGDELPTYFITGISVPVKDIDIFGKLKTNPNSAEGSLLYGSTINFDKIAYQAILNAGTDTSYYNLNVNYNETTDSFIFKPKLDIVSNPTIGEWLGNFINDTVVIDKKEFLTNVMNAIYGSITTNQNKSVEQIYNELQISKLIEQLIDDNDSFEITQSEFDALLQQAQALIDGVIYYDMGCGVIGATLPLSGMTKLISQISGSTDSFVVGNAIEATIDESTTDVQETATENKQTIKDGFFQRLIKIIQQMLAQLMTTSPQIRALLAIISAFENNGIVQIGNPKDDLKKFKIFLKCIIKEATKMINEFIFNLVITFLVALLAPIIKKIIREKINQYTDIIKSLII
jgi:hypothetical protein